MTSVARIDVNRLNFTTIPDKRVAEIEAALSQQWANRRTATDDIDRGTVERNIVDLEGALEQANVNLAAHTAHMAKLEAARVAEREATEQRRQAADDQLKAQEKSTFLASNRTASEDDFERLWPAIRDQQLMDQRNDAIAAARAGGAYRI